MSHLIATNEEIKTLESIWHKQTRSKGPPLIFADPKITEKKIASSELTIIRALINFLAWPEWVILFFKPVLAILAISQLLKNQGLPRGILWVAPGTGAPLKTNRQKPGFAILRTDWSPDHESITFWVKKIKSQGLYLVIDESYTGLRLAQGGATEYYNLAPNAVLYGPTLAGGQNFGALAGRGLKPTGIFPGPSPAALAAAAASLELASKLNISSRLQEWGRVLALGIDWFTKQAQMSTQIAWEGPLSLLRLKGQRIWSFIEICREEGLILAPVILPNPELDLNSAKELVWSRLCRATLRFKNLS